MPDSPQTPPAGERRKITFRSPRHPHLVIMRGGSMPGDPLPQFGRHVYTKDRPSIWAQFTDGYLTTDDPELISLLRAMTPQVYEMKAGQLNPRLEAPPDPLVADLAELDRQEGIGV